MHLEATVVEVAAAAVAEDKHRFMHYTGMLFGLELRDLFLMITVTY